MTRLDGRGPGQLRAVTLVPSFQSHPAGSVLVGMGKTRVICAVSVVSGVPRWLSGNDSGGWLTAEYRMLPGSTASRVPREGTPDQRPSGRSTEIQRLIGRSLRAAVDLTRFPGRTLYVDCDVLDADGGTRCAAITGSCVALEMAFLALLENGQIRDWPMTRRVAAVSAGIVDGMPILDLCYDEDRRAEVDLNVVMTSHGQFVEVQGTAEGRSFSRQQLDAMLDLADRGTAELFRLQEDAVRAAGSGAGARARSSQERP
ncbi:MAG: ribonuclease PH [Lentisphaeria bacterium]|nr:ribonuclease PH [Lentisphaeria bacterium]